MSCLTALFKITPRGIPEGCGGLGGLTRLIDGFGFRHHDGSGFRLHYGPYSGDPLGFRHLGGGRHRDPMPCRVGLRYGLRDPVPSWDPPTAFLPAFLGRPIPIGLPMRRADPRALGHLHGRSVAGPLPVGGGYRHVDRRRIGIGLLHGHLDLFGFRYHNCFGCRSDTGRICGSAASAPRFVIGRRQDRIID